MDIQAETTLKAIILHELRGDVLHEMSPGVISDKMYGFNEFNENACIANFIILSSSMFGRYYREPDRYQKEILIYENIRNNNLLLVKFDPQLHYNGFSNKLSDILFYFDYRIRATDKTRLKGPVIEIYQVENCQYSDF